MAPTRHSCHDVNRPSPGLLLEMARLGGLREREILDDVAAISRLDAWLRAGRPDDDRVARDADGAKRLAGACGGLPFALLICAALLQIDPRLSVGDLSDELSATWQRQQELWRESLRPYPAASAAVFEVAYLRMSESAARLFRLMSVHPGPDASAVTLELLVGRPSREVRRALGALAQLHLVEVAGVSAPRWRLHDLVRVYARYLSDVQSEADGREQALGGLLKYYLSMTEAADNQIRWAPESADTATFASRDGALAWLETEQLSLIAAVQVAGECGWDHVAVGLSLSLAEYLAQRRLFDELLATTSVGLSAAVRLEDQDLQGSALTNLGLAQQELGRTEEAIAAHRDAVAIFRAVGDYEGTGDALNNLGLALREQEQLEESIAVHRDAVAIYREAGNRQAEARAVNNLGLALKRMRCLDEAITRHEEAAAIYRAMRDRHGEGMALGNLARALRESGRSSEAISAWQLATSIFAEIGDDHARGIALSNIGSALTEDGRSVEAVSAYREAADMFRASGDAEREHRTRERLAAVFG